MVFDGNMGRKIIDASKIREDSDYDDQFVVNKEKTIEQIETAKEMIELVEKYLEKNN